MFNDRSKLKLGGSKCKKGNFADTRTLRGMEANTVAGRSAPPSAIRPFLSTQGIGRILNRKNFSGLLPSLSTASASSIANVTSMSISNPGGRICLRSLSWRECSSTWLVSGDGLKTKPDTSERLRTIQTRRNVRATFSDGQRRAAVCAHSTGRPAEAGTAGNGSNGYPHPLEIQRSVARWLHHQPPPLVRPSRNTISCFFSPPRTLIYELFVATAHSRYWHRPTVRRCCGRRVRSWGQLTFQEDLPRSARGDRI